MNLAKVAPPPTTLSRSPAKASTPNARAARGRLPPLTTTSAGGAPASSPSNAAATGASAAMLANWKPSRANLAARGARSSAAAPTPTTQVFVEDTP